MKEMVMGGWMDLGFVLESVRLKEITVQSLLVGSDARCFVALLDGHYEGTSAHQSTNTTDIEVDPVNTDNLVGLLIGVIYYGQELNQDGVMNINGAIFILITNMTFQNVFAVINVFCAELPVFKREHFNGMYRTDVYFLCKTIAEIPVFIVIPVIFISISYYMIGLSPGPERFWMAVFILTLTANVATSFGFGPTDKLVRERVSDWVAKLVSERVISR
ncbi:unnamed protein product [Timema podura]|uniref:ABC-2 type transporter transmembrane domain-containing protein n=1 Tax=Timema podura TaxID=61482 RepID=A0ABN7P7E2_TIMPD|nr:unnamed protein product [Timema podura]